MLSKLMNLLWFILGGIVMGLAWWVAGALLAITIVGLPWARACFVIGKFNFFPFGKEAVSRDEVTGDDEVGTGIFGSIGNILWALTFGWFFAAGHLVSAIFNFITIIGIPFGYQHVKLAKMAFTPVGMTIVSAD